MGREMTASAASYGRWYFVIIRRLRAIKLQERMQNLLLAAC